MKTLTPIDEEIAYTRQSLIAARPNWKIFAPN